MGSIVFFVRTYFEAGANLVPSPKGVPITKIIPVPAVRTRQQAGISGNSYWN